MRKDFIVFVWILAITLFIYSFIKNPASESIFGFEINIWIYRLFWGIVAAVSLFDYYKIKRDNRSKSE